MLGTPSSNPVMQNNDYYAVDNTYKFVWNGTTYTSLASWQTANSLEIFNSASTALNVNPLLVAPGTGRTLNDPTQLNTLNAYELQNTSPMIHSGENLNALYSISVGTVDYYGNLLSTTGLNVGAE